MDIGLDEDSSGPDPEGYLTRFTLDLERRTCSEERLCPVPGDFPRVSDAVAGLAYRYGYMATYLHDMQTGGLFDSITKIDLSTGKAQTQDFGGGKFVGEPIFAADPDGSAEDDGWILTFVSDQGDLSSEFVVLDAHDVEAEPLARIPMPHRVPFGFHGSWLPED
jgi:carotenoid cleavage dioxygenase